MAISHHLSTRTAAFAALSSSRNAMTADEPLLPSLPLNVKPVELQQHSTGHRRQYARWYTRGL